MEQDKLPKFKYDTNKKCKVQYLREINLLPTVLICKIFAHIDMETMFKSVFLVSRYWQDLFYKRESWTHLNVNPDNEPLFDFFKEHIKDTSLIENVKWFGRKKFDLICPRLKKLDILNLDYCIKISDMNFNNLRILKVDMGCDSFNLPNLPNLNKLILSACKLESVYFSSSLYSIVTTQCDFEKMDKITAESFYACKNLKHLEIQYEFYIELSTYKSDPFYFPKLKKLRIDSERLYLDLRLFVNFFCILSSKQINSLELFCIDYTIRDWDFLLYFPNLKRLGVMLPFNHGIYSDVVINIPSLSKLSKLSIIDNDNTNEQYVQIKFGLNYPYLTNLQCDINDIEYHQFENLKSIIIGSISNKYIENLSKCKSLKKLTVLNEITSTDIYNDLKRLVNLTSIKLGEYSLDMNKLPQFIFDLPSLKKLRVKEIISSCGNIKNTTIGKLNIGLVK